MLSIASTPKPGSRRFWREHPRFHSCNGKVNDTMRDRRAKMKVKVVSERKLQAVGIMMDFSDSARHCRLGN